MAPFAVDARSGCCSWHGGVCGCGCCDGTSLSATCAPYYPQCNTSYSSYKPPVIKCPTNSHLSTDKETCLCNEGYKLNSIKNTCIAKTKDELCQEKNGLNSEWGGKTNSDGTFNCVCLDGYLIGDEKKCITVDSRCREEFGDGAYAIEDKCSCKEGYKWNKDGDECTIKTSEEICQEQFGQNAIWRGSNRNDGTPKCKCQSNFTWNKEKTSCVAKVGESKWYKKLFNWLSE